MRFDSALEVQAKVFREVFDFVPMAAAAGFDGFETDIFVDPVLLEESPQKTRSRRSSAKRAVEDIALGITDGKDGGDSAKLAVLVQNRLQMKDKVIDRISAMAKKEVDVTYIGRQKPLWTQTRLNPLRLGGSVSPVTVTYAGTLGCFCRDNLTGADCVLSNNHVFADVNRVPVGTGIKQQGHLDGGLSGTDDIAELLRFVPIQFGGVPNAVDAAAARLTAHGRTEDRAGLYDASTPPRLMASLNPAAPATAFPSMKVQKTGRTTCHTFGKVRAVNVNNYLVNMGVGIARFDGQIVIEARVVPDEKKRPFSQPGDSGSVIVDDSGNPVGLLFAGSASGGAGNLGFTGANPISMVTAQLGVTLI